MKISLNWLSQYIDLSGLSVDEMSDMLTFAGIEVEDIRQQGVDSPYVVVARVAAAEQHPQADRLKVCQVDVGDGTLHQIVCGAQNYKVGDKVPCALPGAVLPGNVEIKVGKLRGVESRGMLCSASELGLPDKEHGLWILPQELEPGTPISQVVKADTLVEVEVTPNRPDLLSHNGMAYELAAISGRGYRPVSIDDAGVALEPAGDFVRLDQPELNPYYTAVKISGVKVQESPEWLKERLVAVGLRPINNIVDITNYVMLEYGQPMHAFDYDQLAGREIVVKCAKDGDVFQTLDGQERKLDSTILMINDGEKEVGIAGIMGGENSKITDNVQTMVFESACFNGTNIRLSAKKVGLRTDASGKYEKGLDPNTAEEAVNRAGEVVGGIIDLYPEKRTSKRIPFDAVKINRLLGTDIPEETMLSYFKTIELDYDPETKEVIAPTWRQDLERMADLAEEVARFYGYDKIPTTLPSGEATTGKLSYKLQIEEVAREIAEFCGFSQGMTYSFESPKVFDRMLIPEDSALRKTVEISNPLGEDFSVMRTTSLNGMLTSLSTNYNRRNKDVRLYELANVYRPKSLPLTELPDERMQFTLGMYGDGDFFTMKGVVEEFFDKAGIGR